MQIKSSHKNHLPEVESTIIFDPLNFSYNIGGSNWNQNFHKEPIFNL